MNLQNQSNIYLVIIPRNYTNDIHICGRCKVQYTLLSLFLKHKETCKGNNFKEFNQELFIKKPEPDSLLEIASLEGLNETLDKDANQINFLNNFMVKDENHLRQYKIENYSAGQDICVAAKEPLCDTKAVTDQKSVVLDCKRTLQNDEEDIATLLANQLSSDTVTEDLCSDVRASVHQVESISPTSQIKENQEQDETKVMYRGKMRKLFNCNVEGCNYKTLLRKDIERHSRVHTGERPFKCFLCDKAFNRTDKLLLHQRIHAGDKRYKCTKCDYASVDSGSLIKHLRVHNGERPFKCQLCSYRARDSSQLTVHLRTHTGDSPFICTNNKCKAAFKTNSDLKRHMVVHSEEKPHSCLYCPYKSTLKRNLQIHIQSQHPNGELREYKCQLCPKLVLPTPRKLKNHMRKQHGVPFEKTDKPLESGPESNVEGSSFEKEETYKRRKRKAKKSTDKIAVGVMNKAYDCKLCEASFVCQDSLITHQRYHSKIEDEMRKVEVSQGSQEFLSSEIHKTKTKRLDEEEERKMENFGNNEVGLSESCVMDSSFSDSLKNAEILASLNSGQNIGSIRQYVMIAPEVIQNVYNSEEYVLVQN